MLVVGIGGNDVGLHFWVFSEVADVLDHFRAEVFDIKGFVTSVPWAAFDEDNSLHNWINVHVNHHWLIGTSKVFFTGEVVFDELFPSRQILL